MQKTTAASFPYATLLIVGINVVAYLVITYINPQWYYSHFSLQPPDNINAYGYWQLLTYMLLHASATHLAINNIALALLGPHIEKMYGAGWFIVTYIMLGWLSASFHKIVWLFDPAIQTTPIIGASGAVVGLFFLYAYLNPNQELYLLFIPVGIPAFALATVYIVFEVCCIFFGWLPGTAHTVHLGAALAALYLYSISK